MSKDIFSLIGLVFRDAIYDAIDCYIAHRRFNSKKNKFYFPKEIIASNGHYFVYEEHTILYTLDRTTNYPDKINCVYKCKKCNIIAQVMLDGWTAQINYFVNNNQLGYRYCPKYIGCTDFQLKNLLK